MNTATENRATTKRTTLELLKNKSVNNLLLKLAIGFTATLWALFWGWLVLAVARDAGAVAATFAFLFAGSLTSWTLWLILSDIWHRNETW